MIQRAENVTIEPGQWVLAETTTPDRQYSDPRQVSRVVGKRLYYWKDVSGDVCDGQEEKWMHLKSVILVCTAKAEAEAIHRLDVNAQQAHNQIANDVRLAVANLLAQNVPA